MYYEEARVCLLVLKIEVLFNVLAIQEHLTAIQRNRYHLICKPKVWGSIPSTGTVLKSIC